MSLQFLISGVLALIMFAVGMSINFRAFKAIYLRPKAFFWGLFSQMIILPLVAFLIAYFSSLPAFYKVGLFIVALCPGGTTSNYISYLIKGNTALSISLTTVNAFFTLLTIPLLTNYALRFFIQKEEVFILPFWETVWQILLVTLIPVLLGVLVKSKRPSFPLKYNGVIKKITFVLLALVFGILLFGEESNGGISLSLQDVYDILPFALLLHVIGLTWGFYFSKMIGFSTKNSITLSIEIGLQNTALALLITGAFLHEPTMTKPAVVYAGFSFWTTLGFAWWQRKISKA